MGYVAKSVASVEAVRRLAYVMQQKLAEQLDAIADSGLDIEAPEADAYFLTGRHVDLELMARHPVVVIIEQHRPASHDDDLSVTADEMGNTVRSTLCELPLRVRLIFSDPPSYTPLTVLGRSQTRAEYLHHLAERYKGAIVDTLFSYAKNGTSIGDIRLDTDMSITDVLTEQTDEILIGGTLTEWTILQSVTMPHHTHSI